VAATHRLVGLSWSSGKRSDRPGRGHDGDRLAQSARGCLLALFTGARQMEVFSATWDQFNLNAAVWRIPTRTPIKPGGEIPLSPEAMGILTMIREDADAMSKAKRPNRIKRDPSPYAFPAWRRHSRYPYQFAVRPFWYRIRREADLPKTMVFHDLRHNFASLLASSNVSELIISKLLRHKRAQTSRRYANPHADAQRQAAELHGRLATGARPIACARPVGIPDDEIAKRDQEIAELRAELARLTGKIAAE
jgi:integrase